MIGTDCVLNCCHARVSVGLGLMCCHWNCVLGVGRIESRMRIGVLGLIHRDRRLHGVDEIIPF